MEAAKRGVVRSGAKRAGRTTRRGLLTGALGLIPTFREDSPQSPDRIEVRGDTTRAGYRSYRDGVASARRRERREPAPAQRPATTPRSWREGAAEVAATKAPASRTAPG